MTTTTESGNLDWDAPEIAALIRAALDEDIGSGDLTAESIVGMETRARARIVAKQDLVLAGMPLVDRIFRELDPTIRVDVKLAEGAQVAAGSVVASLEGRARAILSAERTALNFLARLCGIATLTHRFVEAAEGTRAHIRDTRKTTPLLRRLEKYAVRTGGGANHRFGLFDAVLIKENHIKIAGSVTEAVRCAFEHAPSHRRGPREITAYESARPVGLDMEVPIQVEVRTEDELREALDAGADSLLLDNVSPAEAKRLIEIVRQTNPNCVVEISGGVNLSNVRAYAEAGPDFISIGALSHSAPAADLSLLVE